jgi:hypothetical protein
MKKVIIAFYLCLFPSAFIYSQSEADSVCKPNLENIFKVQALKVRYEAVSYLYSNKNSRFFKDSDFLNRSFGIIREIPPYPKKQNDSISGVNPEGRVEVEWMSQEEMDGYVEYLNCTPKEAREEYRDFIRQIKSEKEIYAKCLDAELAKGDSSEYAKIGSGLYGFLPPGSSILPPPSKMTKLDFLKVFKEFIFNDDEEVLPEGLFALVYLKCNCKVKWYE